MPYFWHHKMLQKIVVIGPESTGKSTLSQDLALALDTLWVPEYARTYLEKNGATYQFNDLAEIAKGQLISEDKLAEDAHKQLICDTDLYVLKVWSEHKYGKTDSFILHNIASRKYDAYILCDIDMPWEADPLREHPDQEMRRYFFELYKDIVIHSGKPFIIASGNQEERLARSLQAEWWQGQNR